jgi:hypothetical protein
VIEPYRVGIAIYMSGPIAEQMAKLSEQMKSYQTIVNATNSSLKSMAASVASIASKGGPIAAQWRGIANDMERAARAAGGLNAATGATRGAAAATAGIGGAPVPYYREPSSPYATGPRRLLLSGPSGGGSSLDPYYRNWNAAGGGGYSAGGGGGGGGGALDPYYRGWNAAGGSLVGGGGGGPPGGIPTPGILGPAIADYGFGEFLKSAGSAGITIVSAETNMLRQGWTPAQVQAADKLAYETQRNVPGSTVEGNLDLLTKIKAVTQDVGEALALLPTLAGVDMLFKTSSHPDQGDSMMALLRSLELKGELSTKSASGAYELDPTKIEKFSRYEIAASDMSHGQISPEAIHQFLMSGGTAAGAMDDYGIFARNMSLILSMGAARAGTAVKALGIQMQSGKMSQASAQNLIDMGIIQGGGTAAKGPHQNPYITLNPIGNVFIKPGGMEAGMQELANSDPVAFVQQDVIPKMRAQLAKDLGAAYTGGDDRTRLNYETAYASRITSRMPGGQYIAEILREEFQIARDQAAFPQSLALDPYKINQANPKVDTMALLASYKATMDAFGVAILPAEITGIKLLTAGLNDLSAWAHDNPVATKLAIEGVVIGLGGLTALAVGGKLASLAGGLNAVGLGFGTVLGPLSALGLAAHEAGVGLDWLQKTMHGIFIWIPEHQMSPSEAAAEWGKTSGWCRWSKGHSARPSVQSIRRPWHGGPSRWAVPTFKLLASRQLERF